jgi:hypothetical protein
MSERTPGEGHVPDNDADPVDVGPRVDDADHDEPRGTTAAGSSSVAVLERRDDEPAGTRDDEEALGDPERRRNVERIVSWVVVAACAVFVFWSLHPQLILQNTTPTGGDMGAHVWGPRFLADNLIPDLRLTGWTQDWYAGFPAYVFYMVVPSLMIVWVAAAPSPWLIPFALLAVAALARWARDRAPAPWTARLALAAPVAAGLAVLSLVLVLVGAGPPSWISSLVLLGLAAAAARAAVAAEQDWARFLLWVGAAVIAVLAVPVPYNVAFKLVAVSGLVTLPIAAHVLARAARVPFPAAPMAAIATLPFIYDRSFTILGGNGASTMAGEFAFSISLTFALLYLAVVFRGVRTGRDRALGAALLAMTIFCHLIPAIFVGIATVVLMFVRREDRVPWWDRSRVGRLVAAGLVLLTLLTIMPPVELPFGPVLSSPLPQWWFPAFGTAVAIVLLTGFEPRLVRWWLTPVGRAVGAGLLVAGAVLLVTRSSWMTLTVLVVALVVAFFSGWDDRLVRWLLLAGPVGVLVTGFWSLPFLFNSTYMNDMGWEKYTQYTDYLLSDPSLDSGGMPYRNIVFALAGLGVLLSLIHRVRFGWFLTLTVVAFAWIFRYFPQYRLWNARLLPFFYLGLYLLAALAVALAIRSLAIAVAELRRRRAEPLGISVAGVSLVAVLVGIVLVASFRSLPGGESVADPAGRSLYRWAGIDFETGIVPDWARWNFEGIESKDAYPEFSGIMDMMARVGDEHGCGRAMWEYEGDLQRFGTPMALMLLPYFTDSCIGSMEGLYFEASSTTPFHFLNQSALSEQPSRAQRDLPYTPFDIDLGVQQLQMLGVRYYMATSANAIEAARGHEDLTELAAERFVGSGSADGISQHDWVVFEVADSDLVVGVENVPVVLDGVDDHIDGWVYAAEHPPEVEGQPRPPKAPGPSVLWFQDPQRWDTHIATSGPDDWPTATFEEVDAAATPAPEVSVSGITTTSDSVSFQVDRTGVPVLVRTSYFPNWAADGAEGPFRVSPNFMVVVPTETEVTLSYEHRALDLLGWALTFAGMAGVAYLGVLDLRRRRREQDDLVDEPADDEVAGSDVADDDVAGSDVVDDDPADPPPRGDPAPTGA